MRKRVIGVMLYWVIINMIYYSPHASALSCALLTSERLLEFDGAIVATVTHAKQVGQVRNIEVRVIESYKGVTTSTLTISEHTYGEMGSRKGETYIYGLAYVDNEWVTSVCANLNQRSEYYAPLHADLAPYQTLELYEAKEPNTMNTRTIYMVSAVSILLAVSVTNIVIYTRKRVRNK